MTCCVMGMFECQHATTQLFRRLDAWPGAWWSLPQSGQMHKVKGHPTEPGYSTHMGVSRNWCSP